MPPVTSPDEDQSTKPEGSHDQTDRGNPSSRLGKASSFVGRHRRKFIVGGVGGGAIAGLLSLFFSFLPVFQTQTLMKNLYRHNFARVTYSFEKTREKALRKYLADRFDQNRDGGIKDDTRGVWPTIFRKWHTGGLERRLMDKGYKIEYQGKDPKRAILSITDPSGEKHDYRTIFQKKEARTRMLAVADEITHGENYFKRLWVKLRITRRTHTHWHWLDPIKQPYQKIKYKVANETMAFILRNDAVRALSSRIMTSFLGKDISEKYTEKLIAQAASEQVAAKVTATALTETLAQSSNPVTLAILAATCACAITEFVQDEEMQKIARQKAELEDMITYSKWQSVSDQLISGETSGDMVGANMELLVDENGRDMYGSNNFRRSTGEDIAYKPSDDCASGREMCESSQPKHVLDKTTIGRVLNGSSDILNSPWYRVIPFVPGSYSMEFLCKTVIAAIDAIFSLLGEGIDFLLSNPVSPVREPWKDFKGFSADIIGALFDKVLKFIVPPRIDGTTRGPLLVNAVASGANLSANYHQREWCGDPEEEEKCKLSPQEAAEVATLYKQGSKGDHSLGRRLASLENPDSLLSRLLLATPTTPKAAAIRTSQAVTAALNPKNWFNLVLGLVPAARADTAYQNPFGHDDYGYTRAQLETGLGSELLAPLEREVGCSMVAEFSSDSDFPAECRENDRDLDDTSGSGSAIDMATLFQDSTNVACAANTKDLGIQDGYHEGKKIPIRICAVSNFPSTSGESNNGYGVTGAGGKAVVNSRVSGAVFAMVDAAKRAGVNLTAISAFRTMAHQQSLCPCDGVNVAVPGYSNHQMGVALDFGGLPSTAGPIPGSAIWRWLSSHAEEFGFKNYPREAWHWSPTGN